MPQKLSPEVRARRTREANEKYRTNARWREAKKQEARDRRVMYKLEVLSHYGPGGRLQCSWPDCPVIDPDMLSLDHIDDDGANDRRQKTYGWAGGPFYSKMRVLNFPKGYQTMCWNHQWKKRLLSLRRPAQAVLFPT